MDGEQIIFKEGRNRSFVAYRPLTGADLAGWPGRDLTHLKIRVEYCEGGQNYFSGGYNRRGFRVAVTPVTRNGDGMESYVMMGDRRSCGGYVMIEEAKRFNARRLAELARSFDDKIERIALAVIADNVHDLIELIQGPQAGQAVAHVV